jgi:hypothetical protein
MSRKWNGKALIDELATRLWDASDANKGRIATWINEIQDDIVSDIPLDYYKFKMKKLMPVSQDIIEISPDIHAAPTVSIASGGTLIENYVYKVLITNVIWDADLKTYIESEAGAESAEVTATAVNKTINISAIQVMGGTSTAAPTNVHRRVYIMVKTDAAGAEFSEPFFSGDITDNTTTTFSITLPTTSTISPPSDSEVDQTTGDNFVNVQSGRFLERQDMDDLRRYNPKGSDGSPSYYDYVGTHRIKLYPRLSASSTEDQKTFTYFVFRRPHEIFYDITRPVDMPIVFKKALIEGVLWKGYEFRDRDGHQSKMNNYHMFKKEALNKTRRLKNRPSVVRDVCGDTFGYEV